jgi:hypothetical protein
MRSEIDHAEAEHDGDADRCDQQSDPCNARPEGSDWFEIRARHEPLDPARLRPALT